MAPTCPWVRLKSVAHSATRNPRTTNPNAVAISATMHAMNDRVSLVMLPVCPVIRSSKLAFALCQVLDEEKPALAGTDYIEIAVAVDIYHRDLHPSAHAAAIVDDMFDPLAGLACRRDIFIPIDAQRLLFAGIAAVVGHEALAGDDVLTAVAVQIDKRGGVRLGPRGVDRPSSPLAVPALFEPEQAVVVPGTGNDVVPAVTVDVEDVHEPE